MRILLPACMVSILLFYGCLKNGNPLKTVDLNVNDSGGIEVKIIFKKPGAMASTYGPATIYCNGNVTGSIRVNDSATFTIQDSSTLGCKYRSSMAPGNFYHTDSIAAKTGLRWEI